MGYLLQDSLVHVKNVTQLTTFVNCSIELHFVLEFEIQHQVVRTQILTLLTDLINVGVS